MGPSASDSSDRWPEVARILDLLLELAPAERPTFLDQACAGDHVLRAEVEAMLAGAEADDFLRTPAAVLAAPLVGGEAPDAPDQLLEGRIVGAYRLIRELGHGGMGVVFLAERADGQFEQQVALKLIKRGMDSEEILRRFLSERQVLARLNHAHIARLLDGGITDQGQPWFAMEYVEGTRLNRYCESKQLSIEQRLALFREVCEAVQYAHRNLVVHRDLKPSNILVTPAGEIKLVDFGIAKVLYQESAEETATGTEYRLMTPEYAAPEQVRGEPVTTATDVYALGAILYELLTGRRAHQLAGHSRAERERVICEVEPEQPSAVLRGTPSERRVRGDLDLIVLEALRKNPLRRYPSVEALLEDLERHRTGLPVRARPDSVLYRSRKFLGRHRLAVGAAVIVFLSLAAGLAGTLWQARATSREAAKAQAVKNFVVSLFRVSQPEESRGREITARELLERGARRIDTRLGRQPELQAEMLDVLGVIHRDLGLYPEADSLLERAVQLSRKLDGESHPEVAAKLTNWASVLAARGNYARAESLLIRAHEILRRTRGPEDTAATTTLSALASVARMKGSFVRAESLSREALRIDRERMGGPPLRVAMDLDNLGQVQEEAGDLRRADSSYQEALALRRGLLDPDHPEVIMTLHHLAILREKQGEFSEAERLEREVLARRRRIYPAGHPEIAYALQSLGKTLQIQGGYAEAESLTVEALAILRARLGSDHSETIELVSNLATLKYERGDLRAAESTFREVLAAWRRSLGADHPTTLSALNDVAAVLKYQGRYEEAEPLYREALSLRRKRLGDSHPDVGESWGNLAELLAAKGELAEAERNYRQTLRIYRTSLPPGNIYAAGALLGLGGIMIDQKRAAEAEPLLREAVTLRLQKLGPTDRRTARAQRLLGLCFLAQGRPSEAEGFLLQSYTTLAAATNWYHRTLREHNVQDLVALYQGWGKRAEAERYRALLTGTAEPTRSTSLAP
jgi:eukaryotic-like serine/threonine-protein kinase